jgi:hypothetical protein
MNTTINPYDSYDNNEKENYTSCFYSSFVFIINIIVAYLYKHYLYSFLFLLLFITSIIVHSNYSLTTNIIDKFSISFVVLWGAYIFFQKCCHTLSWKQTIVAFFVILTLLLTIYLYIYGWFTDQYCYCKQQDLAKSYHSIMHLISSFGHVLIVIM